jgi:hypothetical protein
MADQDPAANQTTEVNLSKNINSAAEAVALIHRIAMHT